VDYKVLIRLRRLSQIGFFAFFCVLLLKTEFSGSIRAAGPDIRLDYPVRFFFEIDPLAAVANALASHALYRGLVWSLVIIVPTLFLGRFFCGWICPLGALNHFFGSLGRRGRRRVESNRYRPWQATKYFLLVAVLAAAAAGVALVGWLDPFSLLVRSLGLSVLPALDYAFSAAARSLEASGLDPIRSAGGALHALLAATLLPFHQPVFRQGTVFGLIFVLVMAVNLRITRLWCRAACPLGALLAVAARWSALSLERKPEGCSDCQRCLNDCQGGDDPAGPGPWRQAECVLCLNCAASCPTAGLSFRLFAQGGRGPDVERRRLMAGAAAGLAAVPLLRSTPGLAVGRDERLLRPPGALAEGDFLERCLRCGQCMKVCPTNGLQPALAEAGLEGLWTPVLVPHIGYCETSCVLCGQVCPTGAIWEIGALEKGWAGETDQPIRLGTAFFDRGRCLPWAMAVECIVCQEWCPTSPKAIILREAEVIDAVGNRKTVRQPQLDPARCVGCGACEFACVVPDRPAVAVTSTGESRSPANRLLLGQGRAR
jgi:polyferredoxin/Pyruvate/2-oxoacid:ferredoxin oxidoreductase delta subunit